MIDLSRLADLIRQRSAIDAQIAALLGRPAERSHAGEQIAAAIFGIALEHSAAHKGSDGHFTTGLLEGRSVNVKWYAKHFNVVDINPNGIPDYYLVLTGDRGVAASSRGTTAPWVITTVYLLKAQPIIEDLQARHIHIGDASSVRRAVWDTAEIYPTPHNPLLPVSREQRELLQLFSPEAILSER